MSIFICQVCKKSGCPPQFRSKCLRIILLKYTNSKTISLSSNTMTHDSFEKLGTLTRTFRYFEISITVSPCQTFSCSLTSVLVSVPNFFDTKYKVSAKRYCQCCITKHNSVDLVQGIDWFRARNLSNGIIADRIPTP